MRLSLIFAVIALVESIQAIAQHTVVDEKNVCGSCKLVVQREATLGTPEGDGMIPGHPDMLARDSRGRIYVTLVDRPPLIFGPDGRYLGRVGRKGKGPGEFPDGSYHVYVGAGDTAYFDIGNAMLTFTKEGKFVRSVPYPMMDADYIHLSDGTWLVQEKQFANQKVNLVLHTTGPDFKFRTNIPLAEPTFLSPKGGLGRKTGVWFRRRTFRYKAELMDATGKVVRSVAREAPWWVPGSDDENAPPGSGVTTIHDDVMGRVWIISTVPAADWKTRPKPLKRRSFQEGEIAGIYAWRFIYEMGSDAMVDVVDPSGRLLVSQRIPGPVIGMLDDSRVAVLRATAEGGYVIDIIHLTITGA